MTESERPLHSAAGPGEFRRRLPLSPTESQGTFIRETDAVRTELPFRLLAVTVDSIRLITAVPLHVSERIDLTLTNPLQRVQTRTRGEVVEANSDPQGLVIAEVALRVRLMPLMVSLLKLGIKRADAAQGDA